MTVRTQCECKQDIFMLPTVAGHYWPFDVTFKDARLIPTRQSFCLVRRDGRAVVRAMDEGDRTPDGKVLTRHVCHA
jgi:hypothetical protein